MKKSKIVLSLILSLCLLLMVSPPLQAKNALSTKKYTIAQGESFTLRLLFTNANGKASLSNKKAISIKKIKKNQWKVKGLKAGTSTVTITAAKKKYKAKITVKKAVSATKMYFYDSYKAVHAGVGDRLDLANHLYIYATKLNRSQVKYRSSNPKVVTVNKTGSAKALAAGRATITASYKKTTAKMTITVHALNVTIDALPQTISSYNSYDGSLSNQCQVNAITFEKNYYAYGNTFSLYMTISGTKTMTTTIANQMCKIGYKLYNAQNVVVKSGIFYSDNVAAGESFKTRSIISASLPEGSYHLVLENIA